MGILADRERLLKICNTAHRLGQRALGARDTSDWAVKGLPKYSGKVGYGE